MRVIFVNRFYRPDESATSQLCSDLSEYLAAEGFVVSVVTSRLRHDDPQADLPPYEELSGVSVHRVWTSGFGRAGLVGRSFDYLSFYLLAAICLLRLVDQRTTVVVLTDPPLISVPAAWIARYRGARLINWMQDVFPEVAERLGVLRSARLTGLLRALRNWSLVRAWSNVAIGDRMAQRVAAITGCDPPVIPNWALEEGVAVDTSGLRREWGLDGRFVVGYSGNLGRAHQLEGIIEAAALLRTDPRVVFLFVGEGAQRGGLEARVRELGLANVVFKPFQPRERLRESLSVPDIHVASLDVRLEGLVVPSKFVGVIALGKPVLWLGDSAGEIGGWVREAGCGVAVAAMDAEGIATAINSLDPCRLGEMSKAALQLWHMRFRRERSLERWRELLTSAAATSARRA